MKKMKKLLALGMAGAMVLGLAACGGGSTNTPSTGDNNGASTGDNSASTDHKAVTLKLQGAFAEGTDHYYYFDTFCQRVNELSDGSVTVEWGAGPESIPSDQLAEAMQNGVVELVYSPFTYLTTVSPALGGVKLIDAFEARENGGFEYIDNLSQQVLNCHFLARTAVNSPYVLMSNVEITSLDSFKGVVFRGTAAHRPLLEALGAEVVTMGWADVYSAVDKNVVSGVGGTYRDFVDNDLGGKVKYLIDPGFYCSDASLFVSNAAWDKLDDVQREALQTAAQEWETDSADHNTTNNQADIEALEEAGTQVIDLETLGIKDEFLQTAYDAAWAVVADGDATAAEEMRAFSNY